MMHNRTLVKWPWHYKCVCEGRVCVCVCVCVCECVHACFFFQAISRGHVIVQFVCLPSHRKILQWFWESESWSQIASIKNHKVQFLEANSTKSRNQESTESFLGRMSRGYSLGGPSGRSSGSCPVAMALNTHRKSQAWGEKWDLPFNCCVCCCCFPGLIYSLAAVGQLLKHLIYSDVFVCCLGWCISLIILCTRSLRHPFQLSNNINPFIIVTILSPRRAVPDVQRDS